MTARHAALSITAISLAIAGCSHNPGYFPYMLPPGVIVQNHAKPRGPGYFRDFDPKACKIEVTPDQQITAPLGTQVVLTGTVRDSDGQPRRSRRIEWILDGPGNLVEVDESGAFPGRGYKVDNKYAITFTNYFTKTITRGNADDGDDVIVAPGQTFCVVSSSVPGETVVTAYAPAVFNWENSRTVVRITWGDGRFSYPPPAIVRYGGEHTLITNVSASAAEAPPGGYRVRYKILDGPAAVLVSQLGNGTAVSQSGAGTKEAETTTDANGEAAIRLVQQSPISGKTRVVVEVVKPPESGIGPGVVVGRKETVVEWTEPKIHLAIEAPSAVAAASTFPVSIVLDNAAAVDSRNAKVKVTLSDGAKLERSEPPPIAQDANGTLTFELPPVAGKAQQNIKLDVIPTKLGAITVTAEAVTGDGLSAQNRATTRVEQGKLRLATEGPSSTVVGSQAPFKISVTNGGPVRADNVTVWARYDDGLKYATPHNPVELAAGSLEPGQTKTLDLPLQASKSGRFGVRASVTADGNLTAQAEPVAIDVRRVELTAMAKGPQIAYLGQDFDWTVTARNNGDTPLKSVVVRANVPSEVRVNAAEGVSSLAGPIEWVIPELRPGDEKTFRISATALKLASNAKLTTNVVAEVTEGAGTPGGGVDAKAESSVAIIGTPALVLELATPPGVTEVGKRVVFQIRVKNQGTVSARGVEVIALTPDELRAVRGTGPNDARIEVAGKVTYPVVDELRPGETLTYNVTLDAIQSGDARFVAEVRAAHLKNALKEEQAVRVTSK